MTTLSKQPYWEGLIDYYYTNIHFEHNSPNSMHKWIEQEYGAISSYDSETLAFPKAADATFFQLKWN